MFKKEDKYDYDFKCINPTDYTLNITLYARNKLFMKIFNRAVIKLKRKKGFSVKGDPDLIQQFDIPREHYQLIRVAMQKIVRNVGKIIGGDNITIISNNVQKAIFSREPNQDWRISIDLGGLYVKKS